MQGQLFRARPPPKLGNVSSPLYPLRVGIFGIGLEAYWSQFSGLKERLEGYVGTVANRLQREGIEIVNLGLIDTPEKAMQTGHDFRRADVDLIFLYVTTYSLSSTVLPVVQRAKVPVIILNLQPSAAIDYASFNKLGDRTRMTGEWLAHCSACPVPEIANAFNRARIPFHQITGVLSEDSDVWGEIGDWIDAAHVAHVMSHNRLGLMGLLQRDARYLHRYDPPARLLRGTYRNHRGGRTRRCTARCAGG